MSRSSRFSSRQPNSLSKPSTRFSGSFCSFYHSIASHQRKFPSIPFPLVATLADPRQIFSYSGIPPWPLFLGIHCDIHTFDCVLFIGSWDSFRSKIWVPSLDVYQFILRNWCCGKLVRVFSCVPFLITSCIILRNPLFFQWDVFHFSFLGRLRTMKVLCGGHRLPWRSTWRLCGWMIPAY